MGPLKSLQKWQPSVQTVPGVDPRLKHWLHEKSARFVRDAVVVVGVLKSTSLSLFGQQGKGQAPALA